MEAYALVDNNVRRKMDEMLKTWKEPVPGSIDARPVFPPDVTRPIESALIKARTSAVQAQHEHMRNQQQHRGRQNGTPAPYRQTATPPNLQQAYNPPPSYEPYGSQSSTPVNGPQYPPPTNGQQYPSPMNGQPYPSQPNGYQPHGLPQVRLLSPFQQEVLLI